METKKEPVKIVLRKAMEIKYVSVNLVHPSSVLPKRKGGAEVKHSVKRDGLARPIIVRPHPTKPCEYEIIDGHNCYYGLLENKRNPYEDLTIKVDIRYGLTDSDVFKLANTLHIIEPKTTFEKAQFYLDWIQAKTKELGTSEGASKAVAQEMISGKTYPEDYRSALASKQSLLSQYKAAYNLVIGLESGKLVYKPNEIDFNTLKSHPLNKLMELTKLTEHPTQMKEVILKLEKEPDLSVKSLKQLTKDRSITEPKEPGPMMISIPPDIKQSLHNTVYKMNKDVFYSIDPTREIYTQIVLHLLKAFINYSDQFEIEVEKRGRNTRKGYKISAIHVKVYSLEGEAGEGNN